MFRTSPRCSAALWTRPLLTLAALLLTALPTASAQTATAETPQTAVARRAVLNSEPRSITIDGRFEDWDGAMILRPADLALIPWYFTDPGPLESAVPYTPRIISLSAAHDADWIYLMIGVDRPVNLQALDGTLTLQFNVDGNSMTGAGDIAPTILPGADLEVRFSPRRGEGRFQGVDAAIHESRIIAHPIDAYDASVLCAPTSAGLNFELRLPRGELLTDSTVHAFQGPTYTLRAVVTDADGLVADQTPDIPVVTVIEHSARDDKPQDAHSRIANRARGTIRLVSWNAERGSLFERPEPFVRILNALRPDVIAFQELGFETTSAGLADWLDTHVPIPHGWTVEVASGTGTGVATRTAGVMPGEEHVVIDGDERPVRATSLITAVQDRRLLVWSLHLKCCGRIGGPEDQRRLDEAKAIYRAMREARYDAMPRGLVIVGDFNIVGTRTPVDFLMDDNDLDSSDLQELLPLRLTDAGDATTWRSPGAAFLPGRLDVALVSDSSLEVIDTFIFDTEGLAAETCEALGLNGDDCAQASDHLPVVIDLRWR